MDPNQLAPATSLDPAGGKRRKAAAPGATGPRKRSKKADGTPGSEGAAAEPAAAAGNGSSVTPPKAKKQRAGAAGGAGGGGAKGGKGKGKADKAAADDEGLELMEKEEGKVEEEPEEKLGKTHSGVFARDLPWLMYGFGDADKPIKETVDLVEDIAVQFITDTVHAAMAAAAARNPSSTSSSAASKKEDLRLEDLLFAVRRDPRKVARIQELIRRQQEIKDARRVLGGEEGTMEDMPDV